VKVLALTRYGREGSSSRVRFLQFLPALEAAGISVTVRPLWDEGYLTDLYEANRRAPRRVAKRYARRAFNLAAEAAAHDVAWLEAELFPYLPAVAERLLPIPYVVDYDDAVFHKYEGVARHWVGRKIDSVMKGAAVVLAGNPYIAARAQAAGARRVELLPTVVDLARHPVTAPPAGPELRVGWIGTPQTAAYVEGIAGALRGAAEQVRMRLVMVGGLARVPGVTLEGRPWTESTEVADVQSFDVGIMPLPDEPWERGKCGYKLVQYMASARPVVASPVGVNASLVDDAGLLATTPDEWVAALVRLAKDAALRRDLGSRGRAIVERGYSLTVAVPVVLDALRRAAGR
jgi:glycosyltransferase involved in cell wall biosynthesis